MNPASSVCVNYKKARFSLKRHFLEKMELFEGAFQMGIRHIYLFL
jgi:hypothetical protein